MNLPFRTTVMGALLLAAMLHLLRPTAGSQDDQTQESVAKPDAARRTAIRQLEPLAVLVGSWRGVGQPQRGSSVGSWSEKTAAAWSFRDEQARLILTADGGKQFHQIRFSPGQSDGQLKMTLIAPDQPDRELICDQSTDTETLIFETPAAELPGWRCTVRRISDIRVTLLFEQRTSATGSFRRIAEVGYTRAGERLASGNTGERQCVVTGGLGTMSVMFEGKTYYICCEGCRQAFEADPQGTINDYRERIKAEAARRRESTKSPDSDSRRSGSADEARPGASSGANGGAN